MCELRIVSFLPSATEMVCALGLADQLVGITHECDFPPEITDRPVVVRSSLQVAGLTPWEIDATVSARTRNSQSLYEVDEELLRKLAPSLILTQDLCQVCAPSGNEMVGVFKGLRPTPRVVSFTPRSLADIEANLLELGRVTDRIKEAEFVVASGKARLEKVVEKTRQAPLPSRVFCLEWVDPVYCCGHWFAEMVSLAGGVDALSRKGADSIRINWPDVLKWEPEVLVVSPCGFNLSGAIDQASQLRNLPGWEQLPAVRRNRVYAVDANSYFVRPGPRVADGVELLAHLIYPEVCAWTGPTSAYQCIDMTGNPGNGAA